MACTVKAPRTLLLLAALRANVESTDGDWGCVYLDNVTVPGMSAAAFAGHLGALTKAGYYKANDGEYAKIFGDVKLTD